MKRSVKAFILFVVSAFFICLLTACGSPKVPSLDAVAQYSDKELASLAESVTQKDMLEAWGEPKSVNNLRLWPVELDGETKYVIVALENEEIMSVGVSFPLFVTVVQTNDAGVKGLVGTEDYSKDPSTLTFMPSQDAFGNEIQYELGDLYYFQFDGRIMETYPQQIVPPYSATRTGCLSEEEISELRGLLKKQVTEFIE